MDRSRERQDESSELGAFEAMRSRQDEPSKAPTDEAAPKIEVMCPNCGHPVEAGFKFCDWCGRPLPARPDEGIKPEAPKPAAPESQQELPLAPERETTAAAPDTKADTKRDTKADTDTARPDTTPPVPAAPPPIPTPPREEPVERKPDTPPVPAPPPQVVRPLDTSTATEPATRPVPAPPPNIPPARSVPAPRPIERTEPVPTIRRVEERPAAPPEPVWRSVLRFVLHLIVAFVVGALVLAAVAVVVTLVTSGRTALLEIKGVPTAIAVASAVAFFAFLRTSRRGGWVAWIAAAFGIIVLAAAGAYLYRPVFLQHAQVRLERVLNVWSNQDETAVEDFRNDLVSWNGTVAEYQRDVAAIINKRINAQEFRGVAAPALQSLQEKTVSMQTHSNAARNEKLRNALGTLAGVYNDQLTGLRLVSTGILSNDFNSLQSGDRQYKAGRERANSVFSEEIRPLLERAGIDADAFQQSLAQ